MLQPKILPPPTHHNLLPPNRAYTYCSGMSAIPFPGSDNGFSMGTAWWLAGTSLLSDADEAFVSERWAEVGVE